jgi:hypothetical protein
MNNNNKITDIYREGVGAEYLYKQSFHLFLDRYFQSGMLQIQRQIKKMIIRKSS